jgi:rhamnosyl/mannosyltransferase
VIKVLHFFKTYHPDTMGGIEQFIFQLARGGQRYGIESTVLSLSKDADDHVIQMDGHQAYRAKVDFEIASTPFSFSCFKKFAALAAEADVIHYQFPWPFMDIVHFASRVKKPTVVSYQSDIIRQKNLLKLYSPLQRKFLSSVDRIVASSPNYFATSDVLTEFKDKVSVIPIGLDKASYPEPTAERLRFWRTQFKDRFYLFVGVLRYYKGLHILIEAAKGVDYSIVIVGAGPIEAELKAQAAELGLKNIHFLGLLPDEDKVALLILCYGVLFPSHLRSEAFGISLLEGAMFGKPMISSEIGTGTTFINIGGETGLVVPPSDPPALRQAMQYLWEHPQRAAVMGKNAEERYWHYFTADKMVESYAKLYRELV